MRVLLAGQRSFGAAVYDMLQEIPFVEVAAVWAPGWTHEDPDIRSSGREWFPKDPLTQRGLRDGILWHPMEQRPENVAVAGFDLIIAAHSHHFISREAREATKFGAIG